MSFAHITDVSMDVDEDANPALELFSRHPIYDTIFSCLTPLALARMASVNRQVRAVTKDFAARAYNVNRRLARFFNEPLLFRSLMARTYMVISGSFALQFFDRTYYTDSDLDLYLHPDRNVIDVGLFMEEEEYTFVPTSWQLDKYRDEAERICSNIDIEMDDVEDDNEASLLYSMKNLRAVYTFEKALRNGEVRKVQLIVSRVSPLASILDFHSTCVMNIVTYNAAYSLYPYATFERRDSLVVNKESQTQDVLATYSRRGWRVLANPSPLNQLLVKPTKGNTMYSPWFFVNSPRWVADKHSWVVALDIDGVVPPPLPSPSSQDPGFDPVAECGWRLNLPSWGNQVILRYETIKTTVFRWRYTAPDEGYIQSLFPFLRTQGKMEHTKIPDGNTREDIADAWTWWDFVLPMLRDMYLAELAERAEKPGPAPKARRKLSAFTN